MRKLPQDFAFPLGLGSKKNNAAHGPGDAQTKAAAGSSSGDTSPRAPCQDLDTINL